MKFLFTLSAALLCAFGAMAAAPTNGTATTSTAVVNGTQVTPMYRHATEDELVVTFLVVGTDMNEIRAQLMDFKMKMESQLGQLNKFEFVCYKDRADVANVTLDPASTYHGTYDQSRICALEGAQNVVLWHYGGVVAGKKENHGWKSTQQWNNQTKTWK